MVLNAVHSALNQNFDNFEVIVSDNSTNDETKTLISKIKDARLIYKKRVPSLLPIDHLNAILKDVTAEYFMIFHDDDVMHPEMVNTLFKKINNKPDVMAVGSNAKVVKNGRTKWNNSNKKLKSDRVIKERSSMVKLYLTDHIVPLPSYLYRRDVSKKIKFDTHHGGKYCDAAFIIDITSLGSVFFCAAPLMDSYKHSSQDSFTNAFTDRNKLINYIIKTTNYSKKDKDIIKYRVGNIYAELKQNILNGSLLTGSKRYMKLMRILFKYSPINKFPKAIIITFLKNTKYFKNK